MHKLLYKLGLHAAIPNTHHALYLIGFLSVKHDYCNCECPGLHLNEIDPRTYKQHYVIYCEMCEEKLYDSKSS